jgi:hypothetical protein
MGHRSQTSNGKSEAGSSSPLSGEWLVPQGRANGLPSGTPGRTGEEADREPQQQDGSKPDNPVSLAPEQPLLDLQQRALALRSGLRPAGGSFGEYHPNLYEALCPTKDTKGRTIEGLSFTFVVSGDSFVVFVKWPLGGLSTTLAIQDPLMLWQALDDALTGKVRCSWKEMRRVPTHLKKSEQPG